MPLTIEQFPEHAANRQFCFVWTRAKDGEKIRFGCGTQADCEKSRPEFERRATAADDLLSDTM